MYLSKCKSVKCFMILPSFAHMLETLIGSMRADNLDCILVPTDSYKAAKKHSPCKWRIVSPASEIPVVVVLVVVAVQ